MSFKCGGFDGGLHEKSWPDGRKKPWYEYCSTISSLKCVLVNSAQSNESAWQRGIRREKKRKPLDVLLTPMCSHPLDECPSPKHQPLLCRRQIVLSAAGNQLPLTLVAQTSQWEILLTWSKFFVCCAVSKAGLGHSTTHAPKWATSLGRIQSLTDLEKWNSVPASPGLLRAYCMDVSQWKPAGSSPSTTHPQRVFDPSNFKNAIQKLVYNAHAITIRYLG